MQLEDVYNVLRERKMITTQYQSPSPAKPLVRSHKKGGGLARRNLARRTTSMMEDLQRLEAGIPKSYRIHWNKDEVRDYCERLEAKGLAKLRPENLRWSPYILTRAQIAQAEAERLLLQGEPGALDRTQPIPDAKDAHMHRARSVEPLSGPSFLSAVIPGIPEEDSFDLTGEGIKSSSRAGSVDWKPEEQEDGDDDFDGETSGSDGGAVRIQRSRSRPNLSRTATRLTRRSASQQEVDAKDGDDDDTEEDFEMGVLSPPRRKLRTRSKVLQENHRRTGGSPAASNGSLASGRPKRAVARRARAPIFTADSASIDLSDRPETATSPEASVAPAPKKRATRVVRSPPETDTERPSEPVLLSKLPYPSTVSIKPSRESEERKGMEEFGLGQHVKPLTNGLDYYQQATPTWNSAVNYGNFATNTLQERSQSFTNGSFMSSSMMNGRSNGSKRSTKPIILGLGIPNGYLPVDEYARPAVNGEMKFEHFEPRYQNGLGGPPHGNSFHAHSPNMYNPPPTPYQYQYSYSNPTPNAYTYAFPPQQPLHQPSPVPSPITAQWYSTPNPFTNGFTPSVHVPMESPQVSLPPTPIVNSRPHPAAFSFRPPPPIVVQVPPATPPPSVRISPPSSERAEVPPGDNMVISDEDAEGEEELLEEEDAEGEPDLGW